MDDDDHLYQILLSLIWEFEDSVLALFLGNPVLGIFNL